MTRRAEKSRSRSLFVAHDYGVDLRRNVVSLRGCVVNCYKTESVYYTALIKANHHQVFCVVLVGGKFVCEKK